MSASPALSCSVCGAPKIKARGMCKKDYELWLDANTERAWKRTLYPEDEDLVKLASGFKTLSEVAKSLGITRESFRDYLGRRPELRERVKAAVDTNKIGMKASRLAWVRKNPEKVRDMNRKWARNQDPAIRAKWNSYNRERRKALTNGYVMTDDDVEFASILRSDPCSYCNAFGKPTIDHILPIESGGSSGWQNLAGACHSCNSSKNDTSLLRYLLRESTKAKELENA